MSLLMDALRRAETPASDTAPDATTPAQETPVPAQKDATRLALEPLQGAVPATEIPAGNPPVASTPMESSANAPAAEEPVSEPSADKPGRVVLAPRSAGTHNTLMFTSGLVFILIAVGGYYMWRSSQLPAPGHFPPATLIDEPLPRGDKPTTVPRHSLTAKPEPVPAQTVVTHVVNGTTSPATQPRSTETGSARKATQRPTPAIHISKKRKSPAVNPRLAEAYNAYRQQDFTRAENLYREVLHRHPANRDAALGLAAIALYRDRYAEARHYYEQVLKTHPRDNVARVALQSLVGSGDTLKDSSQLKHWLQENPNDPQLYFALASHEADSGNWKAAQQAYFEAFRLAPDRADYAFNLAVSLDRLGLGTQALAYYRKARELAGHNPIFSMKQLDRRIAQLEKPVEPGS